MGLAGGVSKFYVCCVVTRLTWSQAFGGETGLWMGNGEAGKM